jgi:hypothetical protein
VHHEESGQRSRSFFPGQIRVVLNGLEQSFVGAIHESPLHREYRVSYHNFPNIDLARHGSGNQRRAVLLQPPDSRLDSLHQPVNLRGFAVEVRGDGVCSGSGGDATLIDLILS